MRREPLLVGLVVLVAALGLADPRPLHDYIGWCNARALASLFALVIAAQAIRQSGLLVRAAEHLLRHVRRERSLVVLLLGIAASTSMLMTNDVALFVVVPLTLALSDRVALPRVRLVTLEELAVNAGSTLSPVGNPQNLLLWQRSGLGMGDFVRAMAPTSAVLAGVLLAAVWLLIPARALTPVAGSTHARLDVRLGAGALGVLAVVLVLLDGGRPGLAAMLAMGAIAALRWRVLLAIDGVLLATLALMFVGLGHLAELPAVASLLERLDAHDRESVFFAGVLLSQVMSNVPATVALLGINAPPLLLAVAVNVAGSGLVIGSLANLIALKLEGSRGAWRTFHAISLPYALVTVLLVRWLVVH